MRNISQIIDLIKQHCGVSKDKEVAELLKMKGPALSNHKSRGTIPYDDLAAFCHNQGLPLDWLLTGEGDPAYTPEKRKFSESSPESIADQLPTPKELKEMKFAEKVIAMQDEKIEMQAAQILELEAKVADLEGKLAKKSGKLTG